MALNGALVYEPSEAWGRTYVEHVTAVADDPGVPEAVRLAARALIDAKLPGGVIIALRSRKREEAVLEAARTVMAHAYARVVHHGG